MKKEVILLVGPMGCGKSTLCEKEYSNYFRISQDDQGKKEHFKIYLNALKDEKPKIIIDRINHIYFQRKKYIELAKNAGYKTKIIILSLPFKDCYNRIIKRVNHPNLGKNSEKQVLLKALRSYFREYQRPTNNEADIIKFKTEYDPYLLDLSKKGFENFLIIGDVHGCVDELEELIDLSKKKITNIDKFAIIFVGDLFDKGPKIKEVYNLYKSLPNTFTIMGNHEEKLKRYLRGNNISITHGLDKTIKQLNLEEINTKYAQELLFELESLPYMIKLSSNDYVVHAGINPLRTIHTQSKEHLLFMRTFNPITFAFANEDDDFWFEHYNNTKENIYFGHHYHKQIQVKENVYALDGYCVYGKELRGIFLTKKKNSFEKEFIKIPTKKTYYIDELPTKKTKINPYEKLAEDGYLRKCENEDLVLYNYSNKCTFEKHWNEHTLQARGIIFDKKTNKIVARPFVKFFNMGENEESMLKNLPTNLKYSSFEKVDGSLGIIYFYNNQWNVSTRGSLASEQSLEAQKMLKNYDLTELNVKFTYLAEIIYPENKIIVNYGDKKELVLLGCINTKTKKEMSYGYLEKIAKKTGMPIIKRYNYSIDDMIKLQKTLSKDEEGFVVRFENGLRVKIKGEQYLKLAKIIANISPISLWEVMENGKVSKKYLEQIPEEILPDINSIKYELEKQYKQLEFEIDRELEKLPFSLDINGTQKSKKELAIHLKENENEYEYSQVFFPIFLKKAKVVDKYIMKKIRPTGNKF